MCNPDNITTNQAAIAALFRRINRYVGNLAPLLHGRRAHLGWFGLALVGYVFATIAQFASRRVGGPLTLVVGVGSVGFRKSSALMRLPPLARLRHADEHQECLLIGVDRKGPADGQSDAIDPKATPLAPYPGGIQFGSFGP